MAAITSENFFECTTAVFSPCARPDREPDYTSGSGSAYWYTADGVVRSADHWGGCIASCNWYLEGFSNMRTAMYCDTTPDWEPLCGFCAWDAFQADPWGKVARSMAEAARNAD